MRSYKPIIASLSLILIALVSLAPLPALASDNVRDDEKPVRLFATAAVGPIGSLNDFSAASINGRAARNQQEVWSGQIIRASDRSALLSLDFIGKVTLKPGAIARFASSKTAGSDDTGKHILVASIITGEILVRLEEKAEAYVEAYGAVFSAASGASFRIRSRDGEPELEKIKGEVIQTQATGPKYFIRPVARQGSDLSVRARSTRQIQFQVTDEHDRPVPDLPVAFVLSGSSGELSTGAAAGSSVTATTNAQGIVTANFSAGATPATGSVTATVAGTSVSTTVGVTTTAAAAGILGGTTLAVVASAVAAGTVATVVAVKKAQNDNTPAEPVQALPPNIIPRP
jgi:hypothetical protein